MLSAAVLNAIASVGWLMCAGLMLAGILLIVFKRKKLVLLILGILSFLLGLFGLLQTLGLLSGVPVLAFGIPAVLSVYFDVFSAFVQALVFTLLSMVYIAGSCPEPEDTQENHK